MEKRIYELTLLLPEDTSEKEVKTVVDEFLGKSGGEVKSFDFWGKKDLSYPIKKKNKANYGFFELSLMPSEAVELSNRLKLNEKVMRYLLVIKSTKEAEAKSKKK